MMSKLQTNSKLEIRIVESNANDQNLNARNENSLAILEMLNSGFVSDFEFECRI